MFSLRRNFYLLLHVTRGQGCVRNSFAGPSERSKADLQWTLRCMFRATRSYQGRSVIATDIVDIVDWVAPCGRPRISYSQHR